MLKVFFSAAILLLLLVPAGYSLAQSQDNWASKIYSGYFHQDKDKNHASMWHTLFGKKSAKQKEDSSVSQCSIEFKSPVSFTHQSVAQLPEEISYFVNFHGRQPGFKKFIIEIFTDDGQEYDIDPDAEGKQLGINDEHHIFDSYLIYSILGRDIDHLEVVSSSADNKDKYILDKMEIQNDD